MNHDYEKGRKAGYEQGWAACMNALGSRRRKALLKYTDAPGVVYRPGPAPRFAAETPLKPRPRLDKRKKAK